MSIPIQALKKARRYEERKNLRRLKEVQSGEGNAGGSSEQKLQRQLEAARALDLTLLTQQARNSADASVLVHAWPCNVLEACC